MKLLLDFKNTASDQDINAYLQTNGCTVLKNWSFFDKIYLVECATTPPMADILERIEDDEATTIRPLDVISVNQYLGCHNDPNADKIVSNNTDTKDWWKTFTYAAPDFDAESTTFARFGKGINVYILDSGIEASHPEFADANITQLYSIIPGNFADHNGHGTALASVIVGKTCGITEANVKVVKIFETGHQTMQSEILDALDAVANDHPDGSFSVLNASWTIDKNEYVEHKLRMLIAEGIYVICAAGNNGTPIEDVTPASMPDVLTVGSYNKNLQPSDFSNYTGSMTSLTQGPTNHGALDGWAPGEEIWCAGLNGTYGYVSGTSIATAISSAVAASNWAVLLNSTGQPEPYFQTHSTAQLFSGMLTVFYRRGLLEFTDPKYNDSKNLIATLRDLGLQQEPQMPDELPAYVIEGQPQKLLGKLFTATQTKSVELIDPLPSGFYLQQDGMLVGSVVSGDNLGPTNGDLLATHTIRFKRTGIDDVVEDCVLTLFVLPADTDINTIPQDHPVNLILQAGTCTSGVSAIFCAGGPFTAQCFNSCSPGLLCCYFEYPKGSGDICGCTFTFGP